MLLQFLASYQARFVQLVVGVIVQSITTTVDYNLDQSTTTVIIRIACVGDSLTLGNHGGIIHGIDDYPSQLQQMLNDHESSISRYHQYQVKNFGINGISIKGYQSSKEFQKVLKYQPHYVLIGLGTNDAKRINWNCGLQLIHVHDMCVGGIYLT